MANLFFLSSKTYQNPAYVSPRGAKVQGLFTVATAQQQVQANAIAGLINAALIIIADVSSSMDGEGIQALIKTLEASLNVLPNGNKVGIIVFAGSNTAKWLAPVQVMDDNVRQQMLRQVKQLRASGSTCFFEPLEMGVDELINSKSEVVQIEFVTDGESTDGYNDVPRTLQLAKDKIAGRISFNAYGTGLGYDANFMDQLTLATGGQFYHVLGNGSGLDHLIGTNVARASMAAAANVTVEIEVLSGFSFYSTTDNGRTVYEVYRTAPNKERKVPLNDKLLVDTVGVVNSKEGIPYEFTLVGPAIQPPLGQTVWEVPVAQLTVRYRLADGEHVEKLTLNQQFTTDFNLVQQDISVANTMRNTSLSVSAAAAAKAFSVAQTMNDTAAMTAASVALTQAKEQADRSGLTQLSMGITQMIEGMESGDVDQLKSQQTNMLKSVDFDNFVDGMESE